MLYSDIHVYNLPKPLERIDSVNVIIFLLEQ